MHSNNFSICREFIRRPPKGNVFDLLSYSIRKLIEIREENLYVDIGLYVVTEETNKRKEVYAFLYN